MKVAIIGSRNITDFDFVEQRILSKIDSMEIDEIVSGGAKGVDSLARIFAEKYHLPMTEFLPEWAKYKRGAGRNRNRQIIEYADMVIAFVKNQSRGTLHAVGLAMEMNKKVIRFDYEESPD